MALTIGEIFPVGGPAPPDLVVGRDEAIAELTVCLREGTSATLVGPRRAPPRRHANGREQTDEQRGARPAHESGSGGSGGGKLK